MDQNAAFLFSQAVCAFVEAMGMASENVRRYSEDCSLAYSDESFGNLIDKYGIGYNDAIETLRR